MMVEAEIFRLRMVASSRVNPGSGIAWAKESAPYRLATVGFRLLAPEPYLHLSMYTALHYRHLVSLQMYCLVAIKANYKCLSVSFQHNSTPWSSIFEFCHAFNLKNFYRMFLSST